MTVPFKAIDNGRKWIKDYSIEGAKLIPSDLGEWHDRSGFRDTKYGEYDLEIIFDNQRFFGGSLAQYESTWKTTMHTQTKTNVENLINILTALHLSMDSGKVKIITCQPIKVHTEENKKEIREMLLGEKTITINQVTKTFQIEDVLVACEGGVAAYSLQSLPKQIRIIDLGSATVNFATINQGKFIRNESDTLFFGMETQEEINTERMAGRIISELSRRQWTPNDTVILVGGGAETFHPYIKKYFIKAQVHPNAIFANVIGMWKVGASQWQ
jgi:plasmid segregation protein ParM